MEAWLSFRALPNFAVCLRQKFENEWAQRAVSTVRMQSSVVSVQSVSATSRHAVSVQSAHTEVLAFPLVLRRGCFLSRHSLKQLIQRLQSVNQSISFLVLVQRCKVEMWHLLE